MFRKLKLHNNSIAKTFSHVCLIRRSLFLECNNSFFIVGYFKGLLKYFIEYTGHKIAIHKFKANDRAKDNFGNL